MVGMLFFFIILLMAFALNYRNAEHQAAETEAQLTRERDAVSLVRDRLAEERYRGERVWLVYKGSGVPSYYGIEAADPRKVPAGEVRGLLVVSDSAAAKATGRLAELIDSSRPIDTVGHSITIYQR